MYESKKLYTNVLYRLWGAYLIKDILVFEELEAMSGTDVVVCSLASFSGLRFPGTLALK